MIEKYSVLIADDHPIFLRGLVDLIQSDGSYTIVAKAVTGATAFEQIRNLKPDVAILDISMPGMTGLDVVAKLETDNLRVKFIILTMYNDEEYFNRAIDLGVEGYIIKENAEDELLDSLKTVLSGKHYVSPTLSDYLIAKSRRLKSLIEEKPSLKDITATERKILKLISENKTSKEIANELFISHKTVENHRTNIARKLGLKGRNQIILFALKNKFTL